MSVAQAGGDAMVSRCALALLLVAAVARADEPRGDFGCDEQGCVGIELPLTPASPGPNEDEEWALVEKDADGILDQDVEDDAPTPPVIVPSPSPPRDGAALPEAVPPDDLGFLDVVLVGGPRALHCTGVLIAPDAVLTAGHCAPATRIVVGHRDSRALAQVAVTAVVLHPRLDAAVLRLRSRLPVPVRPRRTAAASTPPSGALRLVGFGVDDLRHPRSFGVKRRVDAVASGWGCDPRRARAARCVPGAELVLTAVGGGDTCVGDSGGPVLERVDGVLRLLAITSRPIASGGAPCGRGGVYVRVDVLDAWLTSILEHPR